MIMQKPLVCQPLFVIGELKKDVSPVANYLFYLFSVKLAYFLFIHTRWNVCLLKDRYLTSAFKKKITFAVLIETAHRNVVVSQLKHHWYSFRPEVIVKMENKRETVIKVNK